jgi:hypothetical protein
VFRDGLAQDSDEGEQWFRDEAEQFQSDSGTAFGFAGMIPIS